MLLANSLSFCLSFRNLRNTAGVLFFLALESFCLLVKGLFLLLQPTLLLAQLSTALFDVSFVLCARFMDFILGFQQKLLLTAFTAADRFVDQSGCFLLSRANLPLANALTVSDTAKKAAKTSHL